MKLVNNERHIDLSQLTDIAPLSANTEDNAAAALNAEMTSSLYHDFFAAAFRELASNGTDATREAGKNDPVEITLPTELNPVLIVRDHGIGMSLAVLTTVFWKVNGSTKRESNFSLGCFGIGGLAPLSISDQFTVTTIHDGLLNTAVFFLDDNDIPQRGLVAKDIPTNQPNGTTILIPIDTKDIGAVHRALHTFDYWDSGSLLIDGVPNVSRFDSDDLIKIDDDLYLERNTNRYSYENYRGDPKAIYVVSGGVRYAVTGEQNRRLKKLTDHRGFIARAELGTVRPHLSRETLKERHHATDTWLDMFAASVPERIQRWQRERDQERVGHDYLQRLTDSAKDAHDLDSSMIAFDGSIFADGSKNGMMLFDGASLRPSQGLKTTKVLIDLLKSPKPERPVVVVTGLDDKQQRSQKVRQTIRAWMAETYPGTMFPKGAYVVLVETESGSRGMLSWGDHIDGDLATYPFATIEKSHGQAVAPRTRYVTIPTTRVMVNGHRTDLDHDDVLAWVEKYPDFAIHINSHTPYHRHLSWYKPTIVLPSKVFPRWLRQFDQDVESRVIGGMKDYSSHHIASIAATQQANVLYSLSHDDVCAVKIASMWDTTRIEEYLTNHPNAHRLIRRAASPDLPDLQPEEARGNRYDLLWSLKNWSSLETIERVLTLVDTVEELSPRKAA